ncbi:MAG: hypothetical protein OXC11_13315 [Rhodospirillales bacterium]|nr:hypothetical protein [Rhodospirillales bacterium]
MNPDDAFERSLASLYRAARDDAHWPAATALIEEACGAVGNFLVVGDGSDEARVDFARLLYRGEDRQDLAREYFDAYFPHDEALPRRRKLPDGRLAHAPELYTEEELKTSVAYNEGWRRMGGQHGLTVHFDEPDGLRIVWVLGDPAGGDGWQSSQIRLVERLLPHIRQFVGLRQALAAAHALGAGLAGLLENDRIGVVQLDRAGRVLEANGAALEILRRGDGLLDRDGALDAWLPADRSRLRRLLGRALPALWGEAPGGGSMTVQRPSGRGRLGLHVSPVGNRAADFGGRRVAALVLVVDPARRPRIDATRVAKTLGLTPSEGRMAALLAEGLRVREIAAATGWRENYVRWMIQQVYRKQGVSGQVALVRQVLAADALPRR